MEASYDSPIIPHPAPIPKLQKWPGDIATPGLPPFY